MNLFDKNTKEQRNIVIDMLKGISIIAVVLYHLGLLKSGYLGVDCFFVISGFLILPKIVKKVESNDFRFFAFIKSRIVRLLPSIIIVSVISLAVGYFFWLPNDYENLSESVIASSVFSNNILSGITTKNYWDTINEYKPLMHMWYIGILMEYYIVLPIIVVLLNKFSKLIKKNQEKTILMGVGIISIVSFVLFLLPFFSSGDKFYFIPFRFWELSFGGFAGLYYNNAKDKPIKNKKVLSYISFGFILAFLCIGLVKFNVSSIGVSTTIIGADTVASSDLILPHSLLLVLTVLFSCVFLATSDESVVFNRSRFLAEVGKRSFSIFVWHQVLLALYRYSINNKISIWFIVGFFVILSIISEINYRLLEKHIPNSNKSFAVIISIAVIVCVLSGIVYLRSGVVRDVPELGISTTHITRGMHSKYCDRVYSCKDEFSDNGKTNVLIIGNSFARDWGNILLESNYSNQINIYFDTHFDESMAERIKKADRIFVFENYENKVPDYVWELVDKDIVYCIGTKNFGTSNGIIYSHRGEKDYYNQTIKLDPGYKALNAAKKAKWGDHYIDLIEPVLVNGKVRVFTDDNMFISEDCRHLTEAGAKYYARLLDLSLYV